ncbi:MAG: GerAB/ArcD/ProY family transporter [Alkaliphilus sp.]
MKSKVQISTIQFSLLLMGVLLGSTMIIVPGSHAKQDAWIAYIIALISGIILFHVYVLLASRHQSKNLVQINQLLLGKYLGGLVSILYIWYFIHLASLVLRNFGEYTLTINLTQTPLWFVVLCYVIVVSYAVRSGLEVTARIAELMVPFVFLFQIIITVVLVPHIDFSNFRPIMGDGISPVLNASFSVLSFPFGETVVFLMIIPFLNEQKKLKKVYLFSFLLAGLLLLILILRDISIIGGLGLERKVFPPHMSIKHISSINLDPLIGVIFFISGATKISVCFIATCLGLSQLTESNDHRPFVLPLSVLLVGLSIWIYESAPAMMDWATDIWRYYSIPFQIVIPLMLLLLSYIKPIIPKKNIKR